MKKTMEKPVNWQDFEYLCKKLWGEIWNCPSIKKNGQQGQSQNGVDVYGIPSGETDYFGIQCKGKDDYTKAQLTEKEIDEEIQKALTFKPPLKSFIFATTANKDAKIEEYIRLKNVENRKNGNFSIDLYSWEDIADLIEENKNTYDWYVNGLLHKNTRQLEVLFNGSADLITVEPEFIKTITVNRHVKREEKKVTEKLGGIIDYSQFYTPVTAAQAHIITSAKEYNRSLIPLEIEVNNIGSEALENCRIEISVDSPDIKFKKENYKEIGTFASLDIAYPSRLHISDDFISYSDEIIVPKDGRCLSLFMQVPSIPTSFEISYRLLSKSYHTEGKIVVESKPQYEENYVTENNENKTDGHIEEVISNKTEIVEE